MKLSKKDRLLLLNQYKILKSIDDPYPNQSDEIITILQDGYEIFYHKIEDTLMDDLPVSECSVVLDILSIYRIIEDYKKNNPKVDEIKNHIWGSFKGFDGNNEAHYMGFTEFLINDQGKFAEQKSSTSKVYQCNSHMPCVNKYRNMISKWKQHKDRYKLDKDDIINILEA